MRKSMTQFDLLFVKVSFGNKKLRFINNRFCGFNNEKDQIKTNEIFRD